MRQSVCARLLAVLMVPLLAGMVWLTIWLAWNEFFWRLMD